MNASALDPQQADEWRVEVTLEAEEHGRSLGDRLHSLELDNEARKRLGGSVIVSRDGPHLFFYAWHEQSAREAEQVVRDLLEKEGLAGQVALMRWHPVEEAWKPASEPLPETGDEAELEAERHRRAEAEEHAESGEYDWQVVVELPSLRATLDFARQLEKRKLPVKRRWRYLLVGALTEEDAMELGHQIEAEVPEGGHVAVRANPEDFPVPVFVQLGSLKPGVMRDLGI
jgi:hypothetical protein